MKGRRSGFRVLLLLLAGAQASWWSVVSAKGTDRDDEIVVKDEPVSEDLLLAGQSVLIGAEVAGDVAVAGAEVTLTGPVQGYVLSAGRTLELESQIENDLWAAGETVELGGRVGDNLTAAGRIVRLRPGSSVGQDARLAGSSVTTEGRIERDLSIGAGEARVGGEVTGDVEVHAARVVVLPDAVIQGDLTIQAQEPPEISLQARIDGEVHSEELEEGVGWLSWPWAWLLWASALLILGLAALAVSPLWASRVSGTMTARPAASALTGLLVIVLVPAAALLLLVTVIGVPLAMALLALYLLVLLLASVFVAYRVGTFLMDRMRRPNASPWTRMVVGVLVVSLAMSLPVVGGILTIAVLLVGAGAIALERRDSRTELRSAGLA